MVNDSKSPYEIKDGQRNLISYQWKIPIVKAELGSFLLTKF